MMTYRTTRKGFLAMSTSLAAILAGCASTGSNGSFLADGKESAIDMAGAARQKISNAEDGGHAIVASGQSVSYTSVDVTKTGDDSGNDEADFYGTNAAIYAGEGATLDLDDVTVETNGSHANAVFSYGEGTTIRIANSNIDTISNNSGAIMVTGGGTLEATDVVAHTEGNSSAPIRSDRGGGTQVVTRGTYTSAGKGSPVIYSTADVRVTDAVLESTSSQGVVVEGKNSVSLTNCTLTANNVSKNSDKSQWYQAVMIYQSMSGDAAQGAATFTAEGGSIINKNGDVFFVNNTVCTIGLKGTTIANADAQGNFLRAAAAGWGNEGSNGGQVTIEADGQQINGTMLVDEVSSLNLYARNATTFVGAINPDGAAGEIFVSLDEGSTWELTADSTISSLACGMDAIRLNGYTLHVGESTYVEGSKSSGDPIEVKASESANGPGGGEPPQGAGGEPPQGAGGEPPAKPESASSVQSAA